MSDNIVVLPGSSRLESAVLHRVAQEFGWEVNVARDLFEAGGRRTVAVLFSRDALGAELGWMETTRLLKSALPDVRLVACHGFTDTIDWPALTEAGAFHSLWLPLKEEEVRRSLGFLWQAARRLTVPQAFSIVETAPLETQAA